MRENNVLGIRAERGERDIDIEEFDSDEEDDIDNALKKIREIPLDQYLEDNKVEKINKARDRR